MDENNELNKDENVEYTAHEMTDEEIKAAAENIGTTPLTSYSYDTERSTTYGAGATVVTPPPVEEKPKKKRPFLKVLGVIGLAACFGIVASGTFFGTSRALDLITAGNETVESKDDSYVKPEKNDNIGTAQNTGVDNLVINKTDVAQVISADNNVVVDVVKKNMSCSVAISVTFTTYQSFFGQRYSYESEGGGSGFIVGSNDTELLIATNNHVVENATKIQVIFCDDETVSATVRSTDPDNDLAIISVPLKDIPDKTAEVITEATLGDSDSAEIGEMVIAIGNALGYGQSVTVGYLSAKDREVTVGGVTQKLLQTDAAINGGNSGGPLFNVRGEVVGINCAKYTDTDVEGMCFAIPISVAQPILKDLMKDIIPEEEQGYLGVSIKTITDEVAAFYGWPKGVYVYSVVEGGSAEKSGIFAGDIITSVNGKTTLTSEKLKSVVNSYKIGETITVTIMRNENGEWSEKNIDVTLMKKPVTD